MYNNLNNTFFNRKRTNSLLVLALIFVLSVFAVGCDSTAEEASAAGESSVQTDVQETAVDTTTTEMADVEVADAAVIDTTNTTNNQNGNGNGNNNGANTDPEHLPAADLAAQMDVDISDEEAAALAFMREEEKLARDVYLTLYNVWGTAVFNNIASSEQVHMDAILMLMDQYELADPAAGNEVGVFTNPDLQALYDELVSVGSQSLADALAVGAAIEEIDILDLDEYTAATSNPAILQVYASLMTGSESHLRAFVSQLERESGETYIPQYMSQDQYDAIMSAAGNGQQGGGQGGNGQGGNGQGGNGQGGNGQGGNGQGGNGQGGNGQGGNGRGSNGKGGGNGQTQG